jgi:hypothetical protein
MTKILLIIKKGQLPVCRSMEWSSVPRKGDEVSLPVSNPGSGVRTVESILWQPDGTAHVFLAGWLDGNESDMLIDLYQWSQYPSTPSSPA